MLFLTRFRHLLAALALCATPAFADVFEPTLGVTFPNPAGDQDFVERTVFPQKALGISLAFKGGEIFSNLYVYDGGLTEVPADLDAPVVRRHFTAVIGEARDLAKQRASSSFRVSNGEQRTRFEGCGPQFLWQRFEIALPGYAPMTSYTYLTTVDGRFVKLRISHPTVMADGPARADAFVKDVRQTLGRCPA